MALSPDNRKAPTLLELTKLGMDCIDIRGIEYDPPLGSRGTQKGMKVVKWKASIISVNAAKPMIIAIRETAEEADLDARLRFVAVMSGKSVDAISTLTATAKPKAAPKPPVKAAAAVSDDDLDDLV